LARRRKAACQFVADKEKAAMAACISAKNTLALKDRKKEIGRDLLAKMCRDLKIDPHDL
jgi:DNA-binding Xre family transcriptional regulator